MKKKKFIFWLVSTLVIFALPFVLNFVLILPSPVPENWKIGKPEDWLNFWAIYVGSFCTFLMALIAYRTLKQNEKLVTQNDSQLEEIKRQWKEQHTPRLSCSLTVRSNTLIIEVTNTSPVPAHDVAILIENNTTEKEIDFFQELCENLNNMRFEIPPFEKKHIPIFGIEPHRISVYNGVFAVTLSYNGTQETFNLSTKEINVTMWHKSVLDVCEKMDEIKSSIDKFRG